MGSTETRWGHIHTLSPVSDLVDTPRSLSGRCTARALSSGPWCILESCAGVTMGPAVRWVWLWENGWMRAWGELRL